MPNNVKNKLTIVGDENQVREILKAIQNEEAGVGSIDFNKIISMPKELWDITVGSESCKALEFYSLYAKYENQKDSEICERLINDYGADDKMMNFGKQLFKNLQKHRAADWYDWSRRNWGTKWSAYHNSGHSGGNEITFETAWSRPEPVIKQLSKMFPDLSILLRSFALI